MAFQIRFYSNQTDNVNFPSIMYEQSIMDIGGSSAGLQELKEDLYEQITIVCLIYRIYQSYEWAQNVSYSMVTLLGINEKTEEEKKNLMEHNINLLYTAYRDSEKKDTQVFIINEGGGHWLTLIISQSDKKILLFDPKKSFAFDNIKKFLQKYQDYFQGFAVCSNDESNFQVGGEECGPITMQFLMFALEIAFWKNDFTKANFARQSYKLLSSHHPNNAQILLEQNVKEVVEMISLATFRENHRKILGSDRPDYVLQHTRQQIQKAAEAEIKSETFIIKQEQDNITPGNPNENNNHYNKIFMLALVFAGILLFIFKEKINDILLKLLPEVIEENKIIKNISIEEIIKPSVCNVIRQTINSVENN